MKASPAIVVPALFVLALGAPRASLAQDWKGSGRVEGIVVDRAGEPVPGAEIRLSWRGIVDYGARDAEEEAELSERGPAPLVSDAKGKWTGSGLQAGIWRIEVRHPGFGTATGQVRVHSSYSKNQRRGRLVQINLPGSRDGAIRSLVGEGERLLAAGESAEARARLEAVLPLLSDPDRSVVLVALARAIYLEGDPSASLDRLREAVDLDPKNVEAGQVLSELLLGQGDADGALEVAERLMREQPGLPVAHLQRAKAHLALGHPEKAREDLQEVLRLEESGPLADQARERLATLPGSAAGTQ